MKQLIVIADMEGASGIFDANREACRHEERYPQYKLWRAYGRPCITSDVLAVCNAAIDAGIDDILLYDLSLIHILSAAAPLLYSLYYSTKVSDFQMKIVKNIFTESNRFSGRMRR